MKKEGIPRALQLERWRLEQEKRRLDPSNRAAMIMTSTRNTDKTRGFKNDLDVHFVARMISSGCSYCGEKQLKIGLDRLDNDKGHTKDNVRAACIRCNYARRAMPYDAWLIVAEGMALARSMDLFGEWYGGPMVAGRARTSRQLTPLPAHGTRKAYRRGCDCEICMSSNAERAVRERRARLSKIPGMRFRQSVDRIDYGGTRMSLRQAALLGGIPIPTAYGRYRRGIRGDAVLSKEKVY